MSQRIAIVSCSKRSQSERSNLLIAQSFDHGRFREFAELDIVWGNTEGLATVYNRKLVQYAGTSVEYVAFVHDDVYLDDLKLLDKLVVAHESLGYGIIGVAGSAQLNISNPSLWHLMSAPYARRGFVHHFLETGKVVCTSFGPTPDRVMVIDGLFIAVHLPSVIRRGWKFNENYAFHHYDLSSSLDAIALGLNVGVYPIHVIHESPGLKSLANPAWVASNTQFLAEYGGH